MTIAFLGLSSAAVLGAGYALVKLCIRKPKKSLLQGEYVMFKAKYRNLYPDVPTSHALMIEKIEGSEALVVFMTTKSQILKMKLPLHTLTRAS